MQSWVLYHGNRTWCMNVYETHTGPTVTHWFCSRLDSTNFIHTCHCTWYTSYKHSHASVKFTGASTTPFPNKGTAHNRILETYTQLMGIWFYPVKTLLYCLHLWLIQTYIVSVYNNLYIFGNSLYIRKWTHLNPFVDTTSTCTRIQHSVKLCLYLL
jgi:hypothetical protein